MRLAMLLAAGCGLLAAGSTFASPPPNPDHLTVHEWGTFTVLQDEAGKAIRGVNTDDEPVPNFVHNLHQMLIQSPTQVPAIYSKGAPRSENDVYVRLETPVIYFYPPPGFNHKVDVNVEFHGGWLTQYYPDAKVDAPGLRDGRFEFGTLNDQTIGRLSWHNVQLGTDKPGPQTADRVWTAPREVHASPVLAENGEAEKYLFYRGVGHINAPLRVSRSASGDQLEVRAQFGWKLPHDYTMGPLWLVDVKPNGTYAVRYIQQITMPNSDSERGPQIPATFSASDYANDLSELRKTMHAALVRDGLYGDEAEAMLNTWEVSYFKRPGLRLFYTVPRQWTDHYLPLRLSESADVQRVMVGRIELVTPEQRRLLGDIARGPVSDPAWLFQALKALNGGRDDIYREDWYKRLMDGKQSLTSLHIDIPRDYRAYLELGRFRNALILDQLSHQPTDPLKQFIQTYDLAASEIRGG